MGYCLTLYIAVSTAVVGVSIGVCQQHSGVVVSDSARMQQCVASCMHLDFEQNRNSSALLLHY
jgi:hypothetical protein